MGYIFDSLLTSAFVSISPFPDIPKGGYCGLEKVVILVGPVSVTGFDMYLGEMVITRSKAETAKRPLAILMLIFELKHESRTGQGHGNKAAIYHSSSNRRATHLNVFTQHITYTMPGSQIREVGGPVEFKIFIALFRSRK